MALGKHAWRIALSVATAALVAACAPRPEPAQTSSDCGAIEILVGFGVGGGSDQFARALAHAMRQHVGKPVQVINITGGAGRAAFHELLERPANGCALLALTSDHVVLNVFQPEEVDLSRVRLLARVHVEVGLLSGRHDPQLNWQALSARVQQSGRPLLIGGVGARSFDRVVVTEFMQGSNFRYRYIPYDSAKQMQVDLIGNRLDAIYDEYGVMAPLYQYGQAQPLVVFNAARIPALPDTPAAPELGHQPPPHIWRGVAVSADTPDEIATMLEDAIREAVAEPDYRAFEARRRLDLLAGYQQGEDAVASLARELANYQDELGRR